jgi:predicted ATPase
MLEIAGIIIGIIVGIFVLIFGGRGLIDIARERRERKEQTALNTTAIVGGTETTTVDTTYSTSTVNVPRSVGPLTEATTIGLQPLVGREKEVSFLQERLDGVLQGKGCVVFITGQVGIGKTRLVRELQDHAQQKGCRWLQGHHDKAGGHAYQAWVEMVRGCLQQSDVSLIERLAGPYAGQIAKLVPEVGVRAEGVSVGVPSDPEGERVRLFEGLIQFFVKISHEVPLVLFLDDLQWAPSIGLVHHLARSIGDQRVLTLAAYRDDELKENPALWEMVLAMNRERLFHSLPLKPLEKGDVGQLISRTLEETIAPQLVEVVFRKTEGNPFFVEEVLHLLQDRQAIVRTATGWEVREASSLETPESVKAVIHERLARLGKAAEELLRMAAVIGREFSLRLLKELVDQEEESLIEVLDRCEAARLVRPQPVHAEEMYSFTHNLIQEALYESIGSARRRRHHLRIGQVMEKLYAARLDDRYDALAHHFTGQTALWHCFRSFRKAA